MAALAEARGVTDLFLLFGEDDVLLAQFARDPRRVLEASGLDADAVALLLDGEANAVRAAVESEVARDPVRRRIVTAPRMIMPPPDPDPEPEPDPEPGPEPEPYPEPDPPSDHQSIRR